MFTPVKKWSKLNAIQNKAGLIGQSDVINRLSPCECIGTLRVIEDGKIIAINTGSVM